MSTAALPRRPISEVKDHLSQVVDEAVHKHRPQLIERHGEAQAMLIGIEELRELVRSFIFDPRVVFGSDEVVISLDRHGLVASGKAMDSAIDKLLQDLRDYSQDFLARYEFFRHTPRSHELPWLLRFALTPEDQQRQLLVEEPAAGDWPATLERIAAPR